MGGLGKFKKKSCETREKNLKGKSCYYKLQHGISNVSPATTCFQHWQKGLVEKSKDLEFRSSW